MDGNGMDVLMHLRALPPKLFLVVRLLVKRRPFQMLLACALLYFGFHSIRPALLLPIAYETTILGHLGLGNLGQNILILLQGSFPSLLLGVAIVTSIAMVPSISFRSLKHQFFLLTVAVCLAAVWFELIIPRWIPNSRGDISDVVAMLLGTWLSIGLLSRTNFHRPNSTEQDQKYTLSSHDVGSLTPN